MISDIKTELRGLINKPYDMINFVYSVLKPKEIEKKQYGEVYTPLTLVSEMIMKLEESYKEMNDGKSIFSNPNLKWFDPCVGIGNFMSIVYYKLMNGLKDEIKDREERKKHIFENMLYMSELGRKNVEITRLVFDGDKYKLNLYKGDTLKLDIKEEWGIDEGFDIVLGNPPYQPPSNNKKGGKSIWDEFVKYSLNILKEKGLLLYVHPALWRKPENKMRDIMFNKQIHYLSIHNKIEGGKVFGATTRYDYYLMENIEPYKKSLVYFEDKKTYEIDINNDLPFIPNFGWNIFSKIISKLIDNGIYVIRDSDCHTSRPHVSKTKKEGYDYDLLNSISRTKGKTYCYSSRPHKCQTNKKVIFSNGETIVPFYDNGQLGVTEGGLYILVNTDETGERMVNYLNTSIVKFIVKSTKWSNFETTKQIFNYIPNIVNKIDNINNENIYKYFEFTDEEINFIESSL